MPLILAQLPKTAENKIIYILTKKMIISHYHRYQNGEHNRDSCHQKPRCVNCVSCNLLTSAKDQETPQCRCTPSQFQGLLVHPTDQANSPIENIRTAQRSQQSREAVKSNKSHEKNLQLTWME